MQQVASIEAQYFLPVLYMLLHGQSNLTHLHRFRIAVGLGCDAFCYTSLMGLDDGFLLHLFDGLSREMESDCKWVCPGKSNSPCILVHGLCLDLTPDKKQPKVMACSIHCPQVFCRSELGSVFCSAASPLWDGTRVEAVTKSQYCLAGMVRFLSKMFNPLLRCILSLWIKVCLDEISPMSNCNSSNWTSFPKSWLI